MRKRFLNSPTAYALGMFAMMVPSQAFSSFSHYYYVEKLGLTIGLATLARTIYLIWDAVNQPMAGYWSDRTRTRYGRRRPWIFAAIPLFAATFIMVFAVPNGLEGTGLFAWFVVILILFEGAATILWVNYGALFPELFKGDRLRAKASAVTQGYQIVAILIGSAATPLIYKALGFGTMSVLYAVIFAVFMLLFVLNVQEKEEAASAPPLPLREAFRETLKNKELWFFYLACSFAQTVNGLVSSLIPFYAKYALRIEEAQVSLMMASVFVSVIPLVGVWYVIVRKLGGYRSWRLAFVVYAISVIPAWFAQGLAGGIAAGISIGFGLAGFLVTPTVLSSEIMDRDAQRTGRRREGMYTAVGGFLTRSSGLISALAFYIVGIIFHYESGDNPGPNPEETFRYLLTVVPLCLLAVSFVISLFLKRTAGPGDTAASPGGGGLDV
ncbi:MFS transporter [Cohnella nanjingensis]|uniref:MFS transporter n=1 Tax=Cohnella nanjingensis TaxID=1387779 RepID=A0A7X0VJX9_9BACL|nr:MFS transporter [Cohnella nanjingensis]MBB6675204.1 MFS transporter [Cohnella nanjingensis]